MKHNITHSTSVTSIGNSAFYALSDVALSDNLTDIGEYAFAHDEALTNLIIPASVTTIRKGAFYACSKLSELTIPVSVTSIGSDAFKDCANLTLKVYEGSYAHRYALLNGVRHEAISELTIRNITCDGQNISVDIENPSGNGVTLAVVAYAENGQFVRLATAGADSSVVTSVPLDTNGAKTVKAVLLDGDTDRPLCESKSVAYSNGKFLPIVQERR